MKPNTTSSTSKEKALTKFPWWERIGNGLTYSHVWIGLGAAAQVICSAMLSPQFEAGVTYTYALLVFFASVSFYSFHRLFSLWRLLPRLSSKRWEAVYARQRLLFTLVPLGFLGAAILFFMLPWEWQWRIALPAVLSAMYAIPLIRSKRMRDFGASKVLWLSVGWVWLCTVVPLSSLGELNWLFFAERLFFMVGHTLAFDWRDAVQDEREGVITWPLRFGRKKTKWLSIGMLSLSMLFNTQLYSSLVGSYGEIAVQALLLSTAFTIASIVPAFAKTRPHHLYYGIYVDGTLLLPGVIVAVWCLLL